MEHTNAVTILLTADGQAVAVEHLGLFDDTQYGEQVPAPIDVVACQLATQ